MCEALDFTFSAEIRRPNNTRWGIIHFRKKWRAKKGIMVCTFPCSSLHGVLHTVHTVHFLLFFFVVLGIPVDITDGSARHTN